MPVQNFADIGMDVNGALVVENYDAPILKIDPNVNATIGKNAPQAFGYTLSVRGKNASEELLVDLKADWPDYEHKSFPELRKNIDQKGYLPDLAIGKITIATLRRGIW